MLVLSVTCQNALAQEAPLVTPLLTIDEAVELALEHSPALLAPTDSIAMAEAREVEAQLARWLPSLSVRSTIAPSGPIRGNALESTSGTDLDALGDLGDELGYQTNNSFRAIFPLYEFGKITVAGELAAVGSEVARLQRRKAELELVFTVRQAYAGLQLAVAFDEMISEGTDRLESARESLELRVLEGDPGARTELRQLTIFEADFVGRIADNEMLARMSRRGLEYHCGLEGTFRVTPFDDSVPDSVVSSTDELIEIAWDHRPDLTLLDRGVEAQELAADLARRRMLPDLFFALGFTLNHNPLADDQPSPFAYDPYNSSGLGFFLGLDWKFNFRQIAQARRADIAVDRANHQREEAVGGIRIEIEEAYLTAEGQRRRVEAYSEAHDAAEAWLRQRSIQFDSGLADFSDLKEPLVARFSTWGNYYHALFQYRMSEADIAVKLGLERLEPGTGLEAAE